MHSRNACQSSSIETCMKNHLCLDDGLYLSPNDLCKTEFQYDQSEFQYVSRKKQPNSHFESAKHGWKADVQRGGIGFSG